ncbi:DNA-binding MarR family transcriptional regulator [Actinoalloteichus hoggarensis]|uniref:Multiple antibiotic resistance protein MarR n=1 Tax=Actinoalloteichus hoggarensis TaxID=1470176 RepID=A0A221W3J5_9PSEU|nr:MarR family transcriptional regulator [Actinoalloteichus hoggarensis]ASO20440.1 Multiple antibiotic resistance protein MarR [Actinoalloteichus hoggarensis]MBB5923479.1 DNA-binding MarR family transcriptional regulator [Actinoalloteichus hoggarensis]
MTDSTETGFADAVVRLAHLVDHVFDEVSRRHDLTAAQTQLLCVLVGGPIGMTDLRRALKLEKSSLTGLVDRVERRSLVTRVRDPRDRRAYQIALTEEGTRLAVLTHRDVAAGLDALAAGLPAAELTLATSILTRITDDAAVGTAGLPQPAS